MRIIPLEKRIVLDGAGAGVLSTTVESPTDQDHHFENTELGENQETDPSEGENADSDALDHTTVDHLADPPHDGVHEPTPPGYSTVLVVSDSENTDPFVNAVDADALVIRYSPDETTAQQLLDAIRAALEGKEVDCIAFAGNDLGIAGMGIAQDMTLGVSTLAVSEIQQNFWSTVGSFINEGGHIDLFCDSIATEPISPLLTDQLASTCGQTISIYYAYDNDQFSSLGATAPPVNDEADHLPADNDAMVLAKNDIAESKQSLNIALVDTTLSDYENIADAIDEDVTILYFNGETESATQVLEQAVGYASDSQMPIDSLSIMSHGKTGAFKLGNEWIDASNLSSYTDAWQSLNAAMNEGANLYLFGCNVARDSDAGQDLLDSLARVTQADVFASDDITGIGGDWQLEAASIGDNAELENGLDTHIDAGGLADYADALVDYTETGWSGSQTFIDGGISFTLDVLGGGTIDWSFDGTTDTLTISDNDGTGSGTTIAITDNNGGLNIDNIIFDSDVGTFNCDTNIGTLTLSGGADYDAVSINGGGGTITNLVYSGDVTQASVINANVNTVTAPAIIESSAITITGTIGNFTVTNDIAGHSHVTITGDVTGFDVGNDMTGYCAVTINGNVGSVDINGSLDTRAMFLIEGDLNALDIAAAADTGMVSITQVNGAFNVTGAYTYSNTFGSDTHVTIDTSGVNDAAVPDLIYAETVDSDGNGQIDHIKIVANCALNDDFSGIAAAVAGYTLDATTPYLTNIGGGGAADNVFYIKIDESGSGDTNVTPTVTLTANTSLQGSSGGLIPAPIADTGWKAPSAEGEDYNQWSNAQDAYIDDGNWADEGTDGQYNDWYNFNFGIPAGVSITGIEVTVNGHNYFTTILGGNGGVDIGLSWDGGTSYTSSQYMQLDNSLLSHNDTWKTIGDASDTWGRTWSSDDFTDGNFRIRFQSDISGMLFFGGSVYVDAIQVKVHYEGTALVADDANDAPTITDDTFVVNEDAANGASVGTVSASDPDAGDTLTYSITAGNADGIFSIDANTGEITITDNTNLDRESTASYALTVQVSDGTDTDDAAITINVNDVNEFAPVANDATVPLAENAPNGTSVHTVAASDADATASLTYAITAGNAAGIFTIDPGTGEITVADNTNLDRETYASFALTVQVSDGTNTDAATITVNVADVNEFAPVANDATVPLTENAPNGTTVHTVVATDADAAASLTYTITGGNAAGVFTIDSGTGEITVVDNTNLDRETYASFALTVQVSDGTNTDTATISVNVTDINEFAPVANDATVPLTENAPNGTSVHTVA
ncbi:MAG: DUF4347 domain-containing protein, partial [Desulfatitalea sp.]|nr:DUF4347 domain-containing protein [Desulfatitalea sp.]